MWLYDFQMHGGASMLHGMFTEQVGREEEVVFGDQKDTSGVISWSIGSSVFSLALTQVGSWGQQRPLC